MHSNKLNFLFGLKVKSIVRTFYCGLKGAIQIASGIYSAIRLSVYVLENFCFIFYSNVRPLVFRLFKIQIEPSHIVFIVLNNLFIWAVAVLDQQFQFNRIIPFVCASISFCSRCIYSSVYAKSSIILFLSSSISDFSFFPIHSAQKSDLCFVCYCWKPPL